MDSMAQLFPLLEVLRSNWTRRVSAAFFTLLILDSGCISPRLGLLCRVSSLKRPFRGYMDLQTPRGWANHWHIA